MFSHSHPTAGFIQPVVLLLLLISIILFVGLTTAGPGGDEEWPRDAEKGVTVDLGDGIKVLVKQMSDNSESIRDVYTSAANLNQGIVVHLQTNNPAQPVEKSVKAAVLFTAHKNAIVARLMLTAESDDDHEEEGYVSIPAVWIEKVHAFRVRLLTHYFIPWLKAEERKRQKETEGWTVGKLKDLIFGSTATLEFVGHLADKELLKELVSNHGFTITKLVDAHTLLPLEGSYETLKMHYSPTADVEVQIQDKQQHHKFSSPPSDADSRALSDYIIDQGEVDIVKYAGKSVSKDFITLSTQV